MPESDWVFMGPGDNEVQCLHCGDRYKFNVPVGMDTFLGIIRGYDERHKLCEKPKDLFTNEDLVDLETSNTGSCERAAKEIRRLRIDLHTARAVLRELAPILAYFTTYEALYPSDREKCAALVSKIFTTLPEE